MKKNNFIEKCQSGSITLLLLFFGLFANSVMAQTALASNDTFIWTGATSNDWIEPTNWNILRGTTTAGTDLFPGQTPGRLTDVAYINNGGNPVVNDPAVPGTVYGMLRLYITNTAANEAGSILTINSGASLTVRSGSAASVIALNGGNIVNEGTLTVTNTATGASIGIGCLTPAAAPTMAREFGYSGSGNLSISVSASTTANSAAVAATSLNANTTYRMHFDSSKTTIALATATATSATPPGVNTTSAIRAAGGTAASPLIIGGTGFTIGGVNGGLLFLGSQSKVTINSGTTLTMNSAATNVTNGIVVNNAAIGIRTELTNAGTINILGQTTRNGIACSISSAAANDDIKSRITNDGVLNIDIKAITPTSGTTPVSFAAFAINVPSPVGVSNPGGSLVEVINNGTLTLKNSSIIVGTGFAIWGTGAGQGAENRFINNGTFNISGTVASAYQRTSVINNSIINSDSSITPNRGLTNNATGTINFTSSPANFAVLASAAASVGDTYTDASLNVYTVAEEKVSGTGTRLLAAITTSVGAVTAAGDLTKVTGAGDATIAYTGNGILPNASTLVNPGTGLIDNVNSGVINSGPGFGTNLSVISGVSDLSTGTISPGGDTRKGVVRYSRVLPASNINPNSLLTPTLRGVLKIQVTGNTNVGVDYDQISNTIANEGFNISNATLDITELVGTATPVDIMITNGGTITGEFASVTGLTAGWSVDYTTAGKVQLVYSTLGTNQFSTFKFSAYPNPTSDQLNLSAAKTISKVELFNLLGQKVQSNVVNANQKQLNIAALQNGIYLMEVTIENAKQTFKVVKQ